MNEQQAKELVQRLYDSIFTMLTGSSDGGPAAYDPNKTFITLNKGGQLINPADFRNQWSPGNLDGSTDSTQRFAELVDDIPNFSSIHTPSGRRVSEMYQQLLRATVTADATSDPTKRKAYTDAWKFLHQTIVDEESGKEREIASDLDTDYDNNEALWRQKQTEFFQAFMAAMATPETKRTWPMLAPSLAGPVKTAFSKWRTNKADQVEASRATLQTSGVEQVKRAFADAQFVFDSYPIGTEGGTSVANTRRSTAMPSNWFTSDNLNRWPTYKWEYSKSTTNTNSDYTKYGGSAGFSVGLWSFGANVGGSSEHFHSDANAEAVKLEFKWALVNVRRAWMSPFLFGLPNWKTDIAPKGGFSSGTRNGQGNTMFPLLPMAFLAVKDVTVSANFSQAEVDRAKKAISTGGKVGWGPFSVGGNYEHGSSREHVAGTVGGTGFTMPGVQIIGWVNQILPMCPPE